MEVFATDASANEEQKHPQVSEEAEEGSLPDFLIIGTQKGGTTFLYHLLRQHPYVEPAARKEIHFFDSRRFKKGIDWYRSHFPRQHWENGRRVITGEASPYYLYHPLAAQRAAKIVPQARLITMLRNPVDRAFSDYQHRVRQGSEVLSFEQAIEVEEERLQGEKEKILANASYRGRNHRRHSYLARGVYVDQLSEWHKFFDRDQMLVLRSEDFFERTVDSVNLVVDFLGLQEWEIVFPPEHYRNEGGYEQMNPSTRQRLREYFEPHNERLYEYLSVDFGW
jgi:hypothetical protein